MENIKTWEERRAEEKAEEKAKAEAVRAKLAEVAALLGMELEPDQYEAEHGVKPSGQISSADGRAFWCRCDTYGAGAFKKCHISGVYQRHSDGSYVDIYEYDENHNRIEAPNINVSIDKAARLIANDIKKRLEPRYLARLEKVREKISRIDDYETRSAAALELVKGFGLSEYERQTKKINIDGGKLAGQEYSWRAYVKASREDIKLELYNIGPELAREIVELVRSKEI